MALFTINRYTGDKSAVEDNNLKRPSSELLKELQTKAKRKKWDKKKPNKDVEKLINNSTTDELQKQENTISEEENNNKNLDVKTVNDKVAIKHENLVEVSENDKTSCVQRALSTKSSNTDILNDDYNPIDHFKIAKAAGFTILGNDDNIAVHKVKRHLPDWLLHPYVVEDVSCDLSDESEPFKGIDEVLVKNLHKMGIKRFFPVQRCLIPAILRDTKFGVGISTFRPNDICVSAPTGSGKTIAFALPIVQSLFRRVVPQTRALIVLPTRELAAQIHEVFMSLCENTCLRCVILTGTKGSLAQEQSLLLNYGKTKTPSPADIVVATPGRLVDHLNSTEEFSLEYLRFVVVDEADRMMDQIKQEWLNLVETSVYKKRDKPGSFSLKNLSKRTIPLQKLLFSATLSADPEKLEKLNLFQPQLYTAVTKSLEANAENNDNSTGQTFVGKYTTPLGLKEYMIKCSAGDKPLIILHIVLPLKRVLCFAGTVETTRRLSVLLQMYAETSGDHKEFKCMEFSSNLPSARRSKILKDFKSGNINVLVCSDSMARGMDVKGVSHVILYDAPSLVKTYIHRIGRTARAGEAGTAYTLLKHEEVYHFKNMLKSARKSIERMKVQEKQLQKLAPVYEKVLPLVAEKLKSMKK
ncbi:ATP-dependent RNA helicase DDX51-like isoform X2 [Clavelina lepadiformis]|uniref:ATP-dependent RNA helicase DDX51-like isoform X2 n=1 Tax=Clavelina lepadiformis TaxID=159417 RepID=UPI00404228D2